MRAFAIQYTELHNKSTIQFVIFVVFVFLLFSNLESIAVFLALELKHSQFQAYGEMNKLFVRGKQKKKAPKHTQQ